MILPGLVVLTIRRLPMVPVLAAVLLWGSAAGAAGESGLDKALVPWSPLSVQSQGPVLTIVLDKRRVTGSEYQALMMTGVCRAVQEGRATLAGIREIRVLNLRKKRGFVFEGGAPECEKVSGVPFGRGKSHLAAMTHKF